MADYLQLLQALLPSGTAWPRDSDAVLTELLGALAQEFARVDARVADLLAEADPRTTDELLADWERVCDLPDPCAPDGQTDAQRRDAVAGRLVATGGQSRQYYIDVAAALDYEIEIVEYYPFRVGWSSAGDPISNPDDWRHTWQILSDGLETTAYFTAGCDAGKQLIDYGENWHLVCQMAHRKPAHTIMLTGPI